MLKITGYERAVTEKEIGISARDCAGAVIAVVRGDKVLAADDPQAGRLATDDRLIVVSSHQQPT